MMKLVLVAACAAVAAADLSAQQQSRLDDLIARQENSELAQLLAAKHGRAARQDEESITYSRAKLEKTSVFDLSFQISQLKNQFENAVTSGSIADSIADSINAAISDNQVLIELVREQAAIKADLTGALDTATRAATTDLETFRDGFTAKITGLGDSVAAQADSRKQITRDLGDKLSDFQRKVDTQLATLDTLPDKIGAQVDDKLAPVATSISVLDRLKLTYLSDPKIPVYHWNWWQTHQHSATSWFDGNNGRGYGGVSPSSWTDGNYRAWNMNNDFKYIKRLFIRRGTSDEYGASICQELFLMHSSTTGRMCGVVFRIQNTKKDQAVGWNPEWMYTSWDGWSEDASVSMNGQSTFRNWCNFNWCRSNINMNIPANSDGNRISTIIFVSSSSGAHHMGHSNHERANINQFNDNSLKLSEGLEYRDDLDTITGNWKQ